MPDPAKGYMQAFTPGRDAGPALAIAGVTFIRYNQIFGAATARAMGIDEDAVHARSASGKRAALAVLDDGTVAGYGWISFDAIRIEELELTVAIPRGHAYIWDCATLPPYRGRGIFAALLCFMIEELRQQGYAQIWAGVAPGNVASLKAFARAGFRAVAETALSTRTFKSRPTAATTAEEAAILAAWQTAS